MPAEASAAFITHCSAPGEELTGACLLRLAAGRWQCIATRETNRQHDCTMQCCLGECPAARLLGRRRKGPPPPQCDIGNITGQLKQALQTDLNLIPCRQSSDAADSGPREGQISSPLGRTSCSRTAEQRGEAGSSLSGLTAQVPWKRAIMSCRATPPRVLAPSGSQTKQSEQHLKNSSRRRASTAQAGGACLSMQDAQC